jgi:hypothetical protein
MFCISKFVLNLKFREKFKVVGLLANGPRWPMAACPGQLACTRMATPCGLATAHNRTPSAATHYYCHRPGFSPPRAPYPHCRDRRVKPTVLSLSCLIPVFPHCGTISTPCAHTVDEHRRLHLERDQSHHEPPGRKPPEVIGCQEPDNSRSIRRGGVTGSNRLGPRPTPTATTSSSTYASATFPNHELSTPTTRRPPSPSFPACRSTPPQRAVLQ